MKKSIVIDDELGKALEQWREREVTTSHRTISFSNFVEGLLRKAVIEEQQEREEK